MVHFESYLVSRAIRINIIFSLQFQFILEKEEKVTRTNAQGKMLPILSQIFSAIFKGI